MGSELLNIALYNLPSIQFINYVKVQGIAYFPTKLSRDITLTAEGIREQEEKTTQIRHKAENGCCFFRQIVGF